MSTRATYRFESPHNRATCIYVHYDGYESGAAAYFHAMASHANRRGSLAERFIRAVDIAEITSGHDAHGDTEYRYTVTETNTGEPMLQVKARDAADAWRTIYTGSLAAFIAKHYPTPNPDDAIVAIGSRLMRLGDAIIQADKCLADAMRCFIEGWIGNANGTLVGLRTMIASLPMPHRGRLEALANKLDEKVSAAFAVKA